MIGVRSPLHRFALVAGLALVPLFALWWLSVDALTSALRPPTAWVAAQLLPIATIAASPGKGWLVRTSMKIIAAAGAPEFGRTAGFIIADYYWRRLTLAWPLLIALMVAPPRPRHLVLRVGVAGAALCLLFTVSASAVAFCQVVALANHTAVPACDIDVPPYVVAAPAYGPLAFFAARFGYYGALFFVPLAAPAILWLALNPSARNLFLGFGRGPEAEPSRARD
jgi:hypothetical protein